MQNDWESASNRDAHGASRLLRSDRKAGLKPGLYTTQTQPRKEMHW